MKKVLFLFIALISTINLEANNINPDPASKINGKIRGNVKEATSGKAIEYANIAIFQLSDSTLINGTISDAKGDFQLSEIPKGEYFITIDFLGYGKKYIGDINIDRKSKNHDIGTILLEQSSFELDEITVSGEKNFVDYKIDKKVVNVAKHANAAGGSVAEVLENVPSVSVDIEGNTSLRGSSSFTVLIDGKPSPISGSDILKQIPANSVENIEIITNPSAKYDPEGTTGIINIIMKKGYSEGLNGMISANYATWNKVGGDLNLNYRKDKINYFIIANYSRNPRNAVSENRRESYFNENTLFIDEATNRTRIMRPFKINPGIDLYINNKNTLSLSATFGGWGMDRIFDSRYESYDKESSFRTYSNSQNDFSIDGIYYVANASYQHIFSSKDHKLDMNLSLWTWNNDQQEQSLEMETDANFEALSVLANNRSILDENRNNLHFKTDYTQNLFKGKLELGAELRLMEQIGDFSYEKQDLESMNWDIFPDFTYASSFNRNIYATYATYSSVFEKFEFQLGLRAEKTDRSIFYPESDIEYPMDLFKLYPSLHVSRNLGKTQQLQFSYSRRINRPRPWQLNPYPGYTDSYNYFQGNPDLKPEDTDAFELNYINRIQKLTLSGGLYFRQSYNSQEMVQRINEKEPEVVYLTINNIDRTNSMGLEYMINYLPLRNINLNLSGNLYHFNVYSSFLGEDEHQSSINWDARLNASYNLGKGSRVQFSGIYNGPSVRGQGKSKAFYYFDLGLRKSFLDQKLNLSILVHNVFSNGRFETLIENEGFRSWFYYQGESPIVRFTASYIINNYQRKQRSAVDLGAGAN